MYNIEKRIATWTHLPVENGEPIEVLRYQNGQKYDTHWDYFGGENTDSSTGDRVATVLMYLSGNACSHMSLRVLNLPSSLPSPCL